MNSYAHPEVLAPVAEDFRAVGWEVSREGSLLFARWGRGEPYERVLLVGLYRSDWTVYAQVGRGAQNRRQAHGLFGDGVGDTPFGQLPAQIPELAVWARDADPVVEKVSLFS